MGARSHQKTIAVVGAGIVGICCAIHLRRAGHEVVLLDPRGPGEAASSGNSGNIAIDLVLPFGKPAMLRTVPRMLFDPAGPLVVRWRYLPRALPWLLRFLSACRQSQVDDISHALVPLLGAAVEDWSDILQGSAGARLLVTHGRLRLYRTMEALRRNDAEIERQRACGLKVEILKPADIHALEPALASAFGGAIYNPSGSHLLSPLRMAQTLAQDFRQLGGQLRQTEVRSLRPSEDKVQVTDPDGKQTVFDRVVIAAGAWSRRLSRQVGVNPPLDTERGYHLMLPTPAKTLSRPVTVADPGYTLVQMEEGLRLASGVEFAGLEAPPDFTRIRRMAQHAATILPGLSATPTSEWLGFRPSMPRSLPVIGPCPACPQVLLAFGHGHIGVTLGPTTGRLIAAMVDGREPGLSMAPYLPH